MASIVINKGNEKITSRFEPIHDFFDASPLAHARIYLISACKAAESKHVWNKNPPVELLFFFERFDRLLTAVFTIVKNDTLSCKSVVQKTENAPDLNQHELYCASIVGSTAWDCFPRSLSSKEYANPFSVLQEVTNRATRKEWKSILRDIMRFALGPCSLAELGINYEMVAITELLLKMLDACHLIDVRLNFQNRFAESKK